MRNALIEATASHARRWAQRRQGPDTAPVRLDRRRVYILPTGFGLIYAAIVFAMLLGSMNYNNSLGFALTFLLTGLGLVVMHHCHRNLAGLRIIGVQASEAFAGEPLILRIGLENASALRRHEVRVECPTARDNTNPADPQWRPARAALIHSLGSASRSLAAVELSTQRRGVLRPDRLTISTRFPFGLFRAWSWVYLPIEALVHPRPAGHQPPPAASAAQRGTPGSRLRGMDDFRGFRSYVPGDSPRHIAWKALARGAPLLVKEYAGAAQAPLMFDFQAVEGAGTEPRLSQLCKWIVEAQRESRPFGLRLPRLQIATGSGAAHRRRCLDALALFDA